MTEPNSPPPDPQAAYLSQLREEAAGLPEAERIAHESLIAELAGEVAVAESMQIQAQDYITRAKRLGDSTETSPAKVRAKVEMGKIGWIVSDKDEEVPAEDISAPGLDYVFVNLTGRNRVTQKLRENLQRQGEYDKLLQKVVQEGIPTKWNDILGGKNQDGSISVGKRLKHKINPDRSLNTSYSAYKIDAQGTNNRAIMVVLGREPDNRPVIALAAIYDHDDQAAIYNSLFAKPPRQKKQ